MKLDIVELVNLFPQVPPRIGDEVMDLGFGWSQYNRQNGEPYWIISERNQPNILVANRINLRDYPPDALPATIEYTQLDQVAMQVYKGKKFFLYLTNASIIALRMADEMMRRESTEGE
jgi:hypothetical protein